MSERESIITLLELGYTVVCNRIGLDHYEDEYIVINHHKGEDLEVEVFDNMNSAINYFLASKAEYETSGL